VSVNCIQRRLPDKFRLILDTSDVEEATNSVYSITHDGRVSGLMSVNIEPSFYKGQDCLFVNISTGFDRNGGPNPSQNLCQVSGFVNKDLETLEERRLISSKAREAVEDTTASAGGAVVVNGYTSAPEGNYPANDARRSRLNMKRNKKALRDFQNCRSLSFAEEYNPDLGSTKVVRVTEWQRRNGAIIGHAQTTSTKLPHQVKHQLDLPRNSAFLTDVSLCLAEKMLCLAGKIGKFDKISTLDRHCLFAPLCLEIRRDASQNFSRNVFKVLKSSPVDRGATETCYSSGMSETPLAILSRTIHTANKTTFFLQNKSILESSSSDDGGDFPAFNDRFFAENLHNTIQKNLSILRKHLYDENVARNMIKFHSMLTATGQRRTTPPSSSKVENGTTSQVQLRGSVVTIIKEALTQVLRNKPENPLEFLRCYFISLRKDRLVDNG